MPPLLLLLALLEDASSTRLLLEATCCRYVVLSGLLQLLSDPAVLGCAASSQGQLLSEGCVDGTTDVADEDDISLLKGHRDACWAGYC
jgi:hypothetical protein